MVDPLSTQNMVSQTPHVEKTVASHRENAPQVQAQIEHMQKDKQRLEEHVQQARDPLRAEQKKPGRDQAQGRKHPKPGGEASAEGPAITLVQEASDSPEHKLDVTI